MVRKWISLLLLLFPLLGWNTGDHSLQTYTVTVSNPASSNGLIRLGVYDKATTFPDEKLQFRGLVSSCEDSKIEFKVLLPKNGKFAFAAYHDANANAKLDKNLLGMPIERYGFSNGARGTFSAPSFEEAVVLNNLTKVSIRLE